MESSPSLSANDIAEMTKEELVEQFSGFVRAVAENLRRSLRIRVEPEDLLAYGVEGLLRAHEAFDTQYKTAFTSYAYYRIRGNILDGCRREGWLKRPRTKRRATAMSGVNAYMEDAHARAAKAPDNLSEAVAQVADMVSDATTIVLLEENAIAELSTTGPGQEEALHRKDARRMVQQAAETLDEEEFDVISRFYLREQNMVTIAEERGVSKSWISRVHSRAIGKMRRHLLREKTPVERRFG